MLLKRFAVSVLTLSCLSFASMAHEHAKEETSAPAFQIDELATGLKHPWGLAFLPNGDALVTERAAGMQRISTSGQLQKISGLPEAAVVGQGGYLGLAIHPQFGDNQWVYVCMSVEGENARGSEVYRGKLVGNALTELTPIFVQAPKIDSAHHFGCRLTFDNQGMLYISLGDRGSQRDQAQNTDNHIGTVVRVKDDGSVPSDNPFLQGKAPEIYSYGHRNVQGMTKHPVTGDIWTHEHGPKGGDEINILAKGNNYGWPAITYGINYNGTPVTDKTAQDGMQEPLLYWVPSIAPSGMTFYTGEQFPQWQGDLFVGSLKFRYLHHIEMHDGKVVAQHELLKDRNERVRDVVQGPDGSLYLLTDAPDGKVIKLSKK